MQLTGELKNLGYHIHTQESIKAIIELYEAWNKPDQANHWRAKLLDKVAMEQQLRSISE